MVYLLGHRSMDEISYGYSFPEWDMSKIEAIDPNPEGGISFTPKDLHRGYAIHGDHLLTKVQKDGPKRQVPDVEYVRLFFVSDKFKDIMESFEPGMHQFFSVDVYWEDGEFALKKYFFNVCTRIDSIDRERATMQFVGQVWRPVKGGDNRLVFNIRAIGNAKIWCGKYFFIDNDGFAEKAGWVSGDDGLLARDLNGNGKIDDVSEMFGSESQPGFAALSALDSNSDGVINAADSGFVPSARFVDCHASKSIGLAASDNRANATGIAA